MEKNTAGSPTTPATSELTRATPELCQLVESLIVSSAVSPDATLSDIREVVIADGIFVSGEGELLYPQDRTFLVIELDELIERHGARAAARDFMGRRGQP